MEKQSLQESPNMSSIQSFISSQQTPEIHIEQGSHKYEYLSQQFKAQTVLYKSLDLTPKRDPKINHQFSQQRGINLVCVVDTSGSMEGIKIREVTQTLEQIIQQLRKLDTITLIKFDNEAETLFEYQKANTTEEKAELKSIINQSLVAEQTTQIIAGIKKAFQSITKQKSHVHQQTVVLLFSDGQDNPPDSDTVEKIQSLYFDVVQQGHFVSICAFGFGEQHDSYILDNISRFSGGVFRFIENFQEIQNNILDTLEIVRTMTFSGVKIQIECLSGYQMKGYGNIWSALEESHQKGLCTIVNLQNEAKKSYLFQFILKQNLELKDFPEQIVDKNSDQIDYEIIQKNIQLQIGQLTIQYIGISGEKIIQQQEITINLSQNLQTDNYNPDVLKELFRERSIQSIQDLMKELRQQDQKLIKQRYIDIQARLEEIEQFLTQFKTYNIDNLNKVKDELQKCQLLIQAYLRDNVMQDKEIHTITNQISSIASQTQSVQQLSVLSFNNLSSAPKLSDQSYTIVSQSSEQSFDSNMSFSNLKSSESSKYSLPNSDSFQIMNTNSV